MEMSWRVSAEGGNKTSTVPAPAQDMHVVEHQVEMSSEPGFELPAQLGGQRVGPVRLARLGLRPTPAFDGEEKLGREVGHFEAQLVQDPTGKDGQRGVAGGSGMPDGGLPPEPLQQQCGFAGPGTTGDHGETTGRGFIEKVFEPRPPKLWFRMRAAPGQMASCVVRWAYFYPIAIAPDVPLRLPKGWVRIFVNESGEDPKKRAGVRAVGGRTAVRPLCSSSDAVVAGQSV